MTLRIYANLDALPSDVIRLFNDAARDDVFAGLAWFKVLAATALPPGETPIVAVLDDVQGPLAALALTRRARAERLAGAREIASLANFYSCAFAPAIRAGADARASAAQLAQALVAQIRPFDLLDLHTLAADAATTAGLAQGLKAAGLVTQSYFHFGNWYERVAGDDFAGYMARRPPALRNTIQRKRRKLERDGKLALQILGPGDDLAAGIAAYERVHDASWKDAEPYPDFLPRLVRELGADGAIRLGLAVVDGTPIAAQIWLTAGGHATIFKLAYDERHAELSAGSILTAHMAAHAIERDHVQEIDFGRGDDDYKKSWLAQRREHHGLIACNPRSLRGIAAALRHVLPARLRGALRRDAVRGT
jgi:CelD/BcsL family acetyltransferase involved in cellulose biosynthesis